MWNAPQISSLVLTVATHPVFASVAGAPTPTPARRDTHSGPSRSSTYMDGADRKRTHPPIFYGIPGRYFVGCIFAATAPSMITRGPMATTPRSFPEMDDRGLNHQEVSRSTTVSTIG